MPASKLVLYDDAGNLVELSGQDLNYGHGKILQCVGYITDVQTSQSVSTTDLIINGITKTVIPKGNNSKFLINIRWVGECATAWSIVFNIHMDGVRVNMVSTRGYGLASPCQSYHTSNDSSTPENSNFKTLTESTSVIGVPIKFDLVADSNTAKTVWTNRCFGTGTDYETGTSEIIVIEIGA